MRVCDFVDRRLSRRREGLPDRGVHHESRLVDKDEICLPFCSFPNYSREAVSGPGRNFDIVSTFLLLDGPFCTPLEVLSKYVPDLTATELNFEMALDNFSDPH